MRNRTVLLLLGIFSVLPVSARRVQSLCGTRPGGWREEQFLHRQAVRMGAIRRARLGIGIRAVEAGPVAAASKDAGNIVVLQDGDGVVSRRNEFNLDQRTLRFVPVAGGKYRFETAEASYDAAAAGAGTPVAGLDDDDSRLVSLPFAFPFYGTVYREVWVNSDGNLTFTAGDKVPERSLGRMTAGPPRIAPLYDDLDPSRTTQGVRVLSEAGRFVVSWPGVPEWTETGSGAAQTFQVRLYPDGRIEYAYSGITTAEAVVGIAPGSLKGTSALVSFATDPSTEYAGAVAERFGGNLEVDITTAAQKFYENHEDAYDYLVFFNNESIAAGTSAVAWEITVRSPGKGYGDEHVDTGREYGSAARLRAVINAGSLGQFPDNPGGPVSIRPIDTPVSVIAHESGHLFLAFASVRDTADPFARPMLGYQNAHWFFGFNSEASLLEGNRIQDNGAAVSPRFLTTGTVQGFSPLDQYLMGFRRAEEVEPDHQIFYATGAPASFSRRLPQTGVRFDGGRRDVHMDELLGVLGRRTPDYTVAQRRFRFAFVLVVPAGTEPGAAEVAKLDAFRTAFEDYYAKATGNRAVADTALKLNLRLSLFPAAGVIAGRSATAGISLNTAPAADLNIQLRTQNGNAEVPASVVIPAGARSVSFSVKGARAGVEELLAVPSDDRYATVAARVQVADPGAVKLAAVSGERQISNGGSPLPDPVVVRVTDVNELPYPGVRVTADAGSGTVAQAAVVTGDDGTASFQWTPGTAAANQLKLSAEGAPGAAMTVSAGRGVVNTLAVVNAASFTAALAPGALATVWGVNLAGGGTAQASVPWPSALAGVRVLVNGNAAPLTFVSDRQINLLLPRDVPEGTVQLAVENGLGRSAAMAVAVGPVAPGIFALPGGYGAILNAGTAATTENRPAAAGDYIEIYCTGLGPVANSGSLAQTTLTPQVTIGGKAAAVSYSGLAPGYEGLYQVNAQVPAGLAAGAQPVSIAVGGIRSNEVKAAVQ